ncbi:MAG TPA: helicase, partial [Hyphomonas sp.]|nr:helicase [Hyphomonas sp.]
CAQIAGRAGRFRTDGEFGETATCPPFDEATWQAIEAHRFDPVDHLQWRNSALDFSSLRRLILSLETPSGHPSLIHNPHALDEWVLRRMAEDAAIGPNVAGTREVRRLWDLARLPDFRKAGPEGHARLVLGLAETLANPDARLADKGLERRLDDLSSTQGDIAKLQQRLANIRTWTYAAHRPDWLENPEKWQDRTREIEDSLSDALHEALTARFVDRRTTALLASLKKEDALVTELTPEGDVRVEGHVVGRLKGLTFEPVLDARTLEGKAVRSAAQAAVRPLILERLSLIVAAPDDAFKLNDEGQIEHINSPVAHLAKGSSWMAPRVEIVGASEVDPAEREAARQRLEQWAAAETAKILPTHTKLAVEKAGDALEGLARGIAFRLLETGAAVDLRQDDPSLRLTGDQREALKGIGVRAGRVAAHVPDAQKPAGQRMIAILRAVFEGQPFPLAPEGAGSFALDGTWPEEALAANGYLRFGRRAVRADLAERLGWEIAKRRKEASKNAFP